MSRIQVATLLKGSSTKDGVENRAKDTVYFLLKEYPATTTLYLYLLTFGQNHMATPAGRRMGIIFIVGDHMPS